MKGEKVMKYSNDKNFFEKELVNNSLNPMAGIDYPFFISDFLQALKNGTKVNFIVDEPYSNPGFTDIIIDAEVIGEKAILTLGSGEKFELYLSEKEINQFPGKKYYVNCHKENQIMTIRFL